MDLSPFTLLSRMFPALCRNPVMNGTDSIVKLANRSQVSVRENVDSRGNEIEIRKPVT